MKKGKDAIALLKEDHKKVKKLFRQFERTESDSKKQSIVGKTIEELEIHAQVEEEIFYPAARMALKDREEGNDLLDEAAEEHHVMKFLIGELKKLKPGQEHYDAKYTVLAENTEHHIEEEEESLFPKLRKIKRLDLKSLGDDMDQRKQELQKEEAEIRLETKAA